MPHVLLQSTSGAVFEATPAPTQGVLDAIGSMNGDLTGIRAQAQKLAETAGALRQRSVGRQQ